MVILNFQILQNSVAALLRWGGILYDTYLQSLLANLSVKNFGNQSNHRSYDQK